MKNKVIIKSITSPDDYRVFYEETEVIVNGVVLARPDYGGEPEDNLRGRDYKWVEPLLIKLSEALGAEVTFIVEDNT